MTMTVGKMSALCWIVFVVMCFGAFGLIGLVSQIHGQPPAVRAVLFTLPVLLWWGPFGYAMYLALAVEKAGDPRLLKRGVRGTALVLSAKQTNTTISSGERDWQAPFVYKYHLRVSVPGRKEYETDCSICIDNIEAGQTVNVAVAKHNHKRVTIDAGQGGTPPAPIPGDQMRAGAQAVAQRAPRIVIGNGANFALPGMHIENAVDAEGNPVVKVVPGGSGGSTPESPDEARLDALAKLGQLHSSGVLDDAEFEAEKAKILGER